MRSLKQKRQRKLAFGALAIFAVICGLVFVATGTIGHFFSVGGLTTAVLFAFPAELGLTDKEKGAFDTIGKALETAQADFLKTLPVGITQDAFDKAFEDFKTKFLEDNKPAVTKEMYDKLEAAMKEQGRELAAKTVNAPEKKLSVASAIVKFFEEKGITSNKDITKDLLNEEFELKADNPLSNTSWTGDYGRTQAISNEERYPGDRPTAFLGKGIRTGIVAAGKNILLWSVGAFTEVVGYASELGDITSGGTAIDGSSASVTNKTRKMAKIAARMIMSAETFEDLGQFAQRAEAKLLAKIDLWLDRKILDGDGNNATADTHIYGVLTSQCTAFDAAGAEPVILANEADLVGAAVTQANEGLTNDDAGFEPTTVWMTPKRFNRLKRTKDSNGQYIINKLVTGENVMEGLNVVKTKLMRTAEGDAMLVGNPALIQLWMKRNISAEILRVPKTDSYELYIYARAQVLVEDEDIKGLIYIKDVDTAIGAITEALVVAGE